MVQYNAGAYFPVIVTGDVVHYNFGALSAAIMTGYDRVDCRLHNNTAYSTGVNTRDDRAVLVQYITRALSTGVVKSENSGFCSTI